jgi:hypothetical protein
MTCTIPCRSKWFQTAFAQTGTETFKGNFKPVHWGCKRRKKSLFLFKVTKAMVFVMAIFNDLELCQKRALIQYSK